MKKCLPPNQQKWPLVTVIHPLLFIICFSLREGKGERIRLWKIVYELYASEDMPGLIAKARNTPRFPSFAQWIILYYYSGWFPRGWWLVGLNVEEVAHKYDLHTSEITRSDLLAAVRIICLSDSHNLIHLYSTRSLGKCIKRTFSRREDKTVLESHCAEFLSISIGSKAISGGSNVSVTKKWKNDTLAVNCHVFWRDFFANSSPARWWWWWSRLRGFCLLFRKKLLS